MPYDDPDPADPMMLVGVGVEADEAADIEMAYAFAEEFTRLGFGAHRIQALFQQPFYAGAYRVLEALGEDKIKSIIQETQEVWGNRRVAVRDMREAFEV